MNAFFQSLFKQVDASSLVVLRIGFGALLLFNAINNLALCPTCQYLEPDFLFKYKHFEWVHPWPGIGLWLHWSVMALCAFAVMIGYRYRLALLIFTVGFTYSFLLDQAVYLNHYYMVILFCIIMLFVPAHCKWSVDARLNSKVASSTVPYWAIVLLLVQLEIILIYAGIVKLNADWLNLEPLRMWMQGRRPNYPPFFTFLTGDIGIAIGAYGAIALHLLGAPLLFFRKTRPWVLAAYGVFHIINATVFNIGIFPWFTWFASLLFFRPDWPLRVRDRLFPGKGSIDGQRGRISDEPVLNSPVQSANGTIADSHSSVSAKQVLIVSAMTVWLGSQIAIPMRNWFLPGNVAWTEDGHRFSWRMKLRSKSGSAQFLVHAGDKAWPVNPGDYLNAKQARKMPCIPDMVMQFGQFLEDEWAEKGFDDISVTVNSECSLNGRNRQTFFKPDIDLTQLSRHDLALNWLEPLHEPLKNPFLKF